MTERASRSVPLTLISALLPRTDGLRCQHRLAHQVRSPLPPLRLRLRGRSGGKANLGTVKRCSVCACLSLITILALPNTFVYICFFFLVGRRECFSSILLCGGELRG